MRMKLVISTYAFYIFRGYIYLRVRERNEEFLKAYKIVFSLFLFSLKENHVYWKLTQALVQSISAY